MSIQETPPKVIAGNWANWADRLSKWLMQTRSQLRFKLTSESAVNNGIILWDAERSYPVISKGGEWRQIILEDGHASLGIQSDVNAAAINTAYPLTYVGTADGITLNGSQIQFVEGGEYVVSFSAQIASTSSSTVNFWFWPRINGDDVAGSTMKNALHQNGATLVVSRTAILTVNAGDYLEACWAVDSTSGFLQAASATSFAPAAPASTISITRNHG